MNLRRRVFENCFIAFLILLGAGRSDGAPKPPEIETTAPKATFNNAVRSDAALFQKCFFRFSSDGKHLLVAPAAFDKASAQDTEAFLMADYDLASGKAVRRFGFKLSGASRSYAISQDLHLMLAAIAPSGGNPVNNIIGAFDPASGKRLFSLDGHAHAIDVVALSDDQRICATAATISPNGEIRIWDLTTHKAIYSAPDAPSYFMNSLTLSADGKYAAWLGKDEIHLIDVSAAKESAVIPEKASVETAVFSPDGKTLVTLGRRLIKFWDISTHQQKSALLAKFSTMYFLKFSADGSTLVCGIDKELVFIDGRSFSPKGYLRPKNHLSPELSADGKLVAALAAGGTGHVEIYDTAQSKSDELDKLIGPANSAVASAMPDDVPEVDHSAPKTSRPAPKAPIPSDHAAPATRPADTTSKPRISGRPPTTFAGTWQGKDGSLEETFIITHSGDAWTISITFTKGGATVGSAHGDNIVDDGRSLTFTRVIDKSPTAGATENVKSKCELSRATGHLLIRYSGGGKNWERTYHLVEEK